MCLHLNFMTIDLPSETFNRNNLVLNEDFIKFVYNNEIKYIKSKETWIDKAKIITKNKDYQYDICILSTGYETDIRFMNFDKIPKMYKHIIHPEYQNCAFIGFAASFNWPLVSETQSKWYIHFIENELSKNIDITSELEKMGQYSQYYDYHDVGGGFNYG